MISVICDVLNWALNIIQSAISLVTSDILKLCKPDMSAFNTVFGGLFTASNIDFKLVLQAVGIAICFVFSILAFYNILFDESKQDIGKTLLMMGFSLISICFCYKVFDYLLFSFGGIYDDILSAMPTNYSQFADATDNAALTIIILIFCYGFLLGGFISLVLEVAQRYVFMGLLYMFSPLVMGLMPSPTKRRIVFNYFEMFVVQLVILVLNIFFIDGAILALSADFVQIMVDYNINNPVSVAIVETCFIYAWIVAGREIDSHFRTLGFVAAETGSGLLQDMVAATKTTNAVKDGVKSAGKVTGAGADIAVKGAKEVSKVTSLGAAKVGDMVDSARGIERHAGSRVENRATKQAGSNCENAIKNASNKDFKQPKSLAKDMTDNFAKQLADQTATDVKADKNTLSATTENSDGSFTRFGFSKTASEGSVPIHDANGKLWHMKASTTTPDGKVAPNGGYGAKAGEEVQMGKRFKAGDIQKTPFNATDTLRNNGDGTMSVFDSNDNYKGSMVFNKGASETQQGDSSNQFSDMNGNSWVYYASNSEGASDFSNDKATSMLNTNGFDAADPVQKINADSYATTGEMTAQTANGNTLTINDDNAQQFFGTSLQEVANASRTYTNLEKAIGGDAIINDSNFAEKGYYTATTSSGDAYRIYDASQYSTTEKNLASININGSTFIIERAQKKMEKNADGEFEPSLKFTAKKRKRDTSKRKESR